MDAPAGLARLAECVRAAHADGTPLRIVGGGTKDFLGRSPAAGEADAAALRGITRLEPDELVLSAYAGTPLAEVEQAVAEAGQCLAFEPPRFAPGGTFGGMVASGLSGPARASCGAVRDFVLGASMLNGRGELLHFGGQVMKNVAGFDVSRLLAGSFGTLGIVCEATVKLTPLPAAQATLAFDLPQAEALLRVNRWSGEPLPLRASAWSGGRLFVRLAGAAAAVAAARRALGGEVLGDEAAAALWDGLRDHAHPWFVAARERIAQSPAAVLWRACVPGTTPPLDTDAPVLVEWSGAQRWVLDDSGTARVRELALAAGGHATAFRRGAAADVRVFTPPAPVPALLQRRLQAAFDPAGILNRGHPFAQD